MKVGDLMTRDWVAARPQMPLKDVAELLVQRGISGMPVIDDETRVVGVVSEGDVLFQERGPIERRRRPLAWLIAGREEDAMAKSEARTAGEAMTSPAVTIAPFQPAAAAARLMVEKAVNRLPVVDDNGKLLGIVTRADLVRAFARSDDEIAREISDSVERVLWVSPNAIQVRVSEGEVELDGELERRTDVVVLEHLVEKIPGVVSLRSRVTHRIDDTAGPGPLSSVR